MAGVPSATRAAVALGREQFVLRFIAAGMLLLTIPALAAAQALLDAKADVEGQETSDLSTRQLLEALASGAVLLDARPRKDYAISHIPGALNVAPKPGMPPHQYISDTAEIGRLLNGEKTRAIVLYCNGPTCGKSRRLAAKLLDEGYTNVRRYQLGAPGWRLIGGAAQTLPEALPHLALDRTAVWIDARPPEAFAHGSLAGARNIPAVHLGSRRETGVMLNAKKDGRLPMEDHNARIIVFGSTAVDARAVAQAIFGETFHNVSFVSQPLEDWKRIVK